MYKMVNLLVGLGLIATLLLFFLFSLSSQVKAASETPKEKSCFEFCEEMLKEYSPQMQKMCEGMVKCIKFFVPCIGIVLLLLLFINVLLAVWVRQDATKSGEVVWIWVVLTTITGFIGLIAYLVVKIVKTYEKREGL